MPYPGYKRSVEGDTPEPTPVGLRLVEAGPPICASQDPFPHIPPGCYECECVSTAVHLDVQYHRWVLALTLRTASWRNQPGTVLFMFMNLGYGPKQVLEKLGSRERRRRTSQRPANSARNL